MVVKLRWRKLKSGARSYYLDYHVRGKRFREFLRLHIKYRDRTDRELLDLAKAIQLKKINLLTSEEFQMTSTTKAQSSFLQFFDRYIDEYDKQDKRKVQSARLNLGRFLSDVMGVDDISMRELSKDLCRRFRDHVEAGFTGETAQSYYKSFKKVIRAAIDQGYLTSNPADQITVSKQPTELTKQVLSDSEIQKLAGTHCGNDQVKRAFLLACYTGFGQAECETIRWRHITDSQIIFNREKTGQRLVIPLTDSIRAILGPRGKPDDHIFKLISPAGTNKVLRYWVKRAEIDKHISFYCGRHSFAVRLLTQGVDMMTISKLMGQASTKHLEKYLQLIDHLKRPAMDRLPNIKIK